MALVGCLAILFEAHASEETQPKEGGKEKLFTVLPKFENKNFKRELPGESPSADRERMLELYCTRCTLGFRNQKNWFLSSYALFLFQIGFLSSSLNSS